MPSGVAYTCAHRPVFCEDTRDGFGRAVPTSRSAPSVWKLGGVPVHLSSTRLWALAATLWCGVAAAQLTPPNITVTPLPVGSGARALGRGGAFVAVADDATAASWNPAGLVQLERPECSIVGSYLSSTTSFSSHSPFLHLGRESVGRTDLNYLSVAYPFRVLRTNMVASLNYQQKFDFHRELRMTRRYEDRDWAIYSRDEVEFESSGGVGALSPALGVQVASNLSLGLSVNIFTDEFFGRHAWEERTCGIEKGTFGPDSFTSTYESRQVFRNFHALDLTVGALWDVWEQDDRRITLGLAFDTSYTAKVDRETTARAATTRLTAGTVVSIVNEFPREREEFEIDFPMSLAAGVAMRFSDALSGSCDVTWTDWSSFEQRAPDGNRSLPIGGDLAEGRHIQDAFDTSVGIEYLLFRERAVFPLRAGVFHEQRPSLGSPNDVVGFSLGAGLTTKRFSVDWAYQLRYANDIHSRDIGLRGATYDLTEHMFLASVVVYF